MKMIISAGIVVGVWSRKGGWGLGSDTVGVSRQTKPRSGLKNLLSDFHVCTIEDGGDEYSCPTDIFIIRCSLAIELNNSNGRFWHMCPHILSPKKCKT